MSPSYDQPGLGAEMRAMVRLAVPLVFTQLVSIGANVLEIMLAGHIGPRVMGAVAVGTNVWHFAAMGVIGVMMALSPSVAQLDGAGRRVEAGPLFRQSLWMGFLVGLFALLVLQLGGPFLVAAIGLEPGLAAEAMRFVRAASLGAPALAMYVGCRGLTEGLSMPRPSMLFGLLGLAILAPVGWVLMYVLDMGALGTGIALTITIWLQLAAFLAFVRLSPRYRGLGRDQGSWAPDWAAIRALFRLGGPMAVSLLMESGMFSATALLIGRFGATAVSGHQIALSVASVTFMVPLGLAIATTVRVGFAAGRGDAGGIRRAAAAGLILALASQACAAALMLSLPMGIAGLYSGDAAIVTFAAGLLFLAALFQLSDGAQVTAAAALRGLKDARVPMVITTIAYWVVGMPLGWALTFPLGMGAPGMWWGLIVSLSVAALLLWARFLRMTAAPRLPALVERPAE